MTLVEEMRAAAEFGGYEHDCPDWQGLLLSGADQIDKLQAVAALAVEVMNTVHDGFREEIDFTALDDALVELGLLPPDNHPYEPHPSGLPMLRCTLCGGVTPADQRDVLAHHLPECGWRRGQEIASRSGR